MANFGQLRQTSANCLGSSENCSTYLEMYLGWLLRLLGIKNVRPTSANCLGSSENCSTYLEKYLGWLRMQQYILGQAGGSPHRSSPPRLWHTIRDFFMQLAASMHLFSNIKFINSDCSMQAKVWDNMCTNDYAYSLCSTCATKVGRWRDGKRPGNGRPTRKRKC